MNMCRVFNILLVYICVLYLNYQEGIVGVPLTSLTPAYFCACPKSQIYIYYVVKTAFWLQNSSFNAGDLSKKY